jgi:hypothetical protein
LKEFGDVLAGYMEDIASLFGPEAKVTLVVRLPEKQGAGILLSNDTCAEVIEEMERLEAACDEPIQVCAPGVN